MAEYMNGPLQLAFLQHLLNQNPYLRTLWEDDLKDPVTNEILEDGTIFWAEYGNNIEWGIWNSYEMIIALNKQLKSIIAQLELDGRVPDSNGTFLDVMNGNASRITLLDAATHIKTAVTAGNSITLHVIDASRFTAFTYATVFDGTHFEQVHITAVGANTITVQALVNDYAKGAIIARSTVSVDTTAHEMLVGPHTTYQVSLVEVV